MASEVLWWRIGDRSDVKGVMFVVWLLEMVHNGYRRGYWRDIGEWRKGGSREQRLRLILVRGHFSLLGRSAKKNGAERER